MFRQLLKLLKQSSIYGIGSAVSPLISFVMLPIYTRYLTPEDYGLLALTGVVGIIMQSIFSLGISSGIIRIYFTYRNLDERNEVITSSIIFGVLSSGIFGLSLYFLSPLLAPIFFDVPRSEEYLKLLILTFFVTSTVGKFAAAMKSEERATTFTIFSVLTLVLTLSLNILFVVVLERKVIGILEAGLISNSFMMIIMIPFIFKNKKISYSFYKIKEVLAFGLPLIPVGIADLILNLSDRYFIEHYLNLTEVGIYSLGYRIGSIITIIVIKPFTTAWSPYMFSVANKANAKEIFKNVLVYYTLVSTFVGLGLSIFAEEVLKILATPQYYEAFNIVPLIVMSYILFGMYYILIAGIHIKKKSKYAAIIFLGAAVINLIVNFLLIPILGIWGAAISTLIAYSFLNITFFVVSQKLYPIDHEFYRIFKIFVIGCIIYLVSAIDLGFNNLWYKLIYKSVLLVSFLFFLFLIKFFTRIELDKIKKIISDFPNMIKK